MVDLLGLGDEVIPESARPVKEETQDEQHTVSLGTTNEEGLLKLTLKNQGVVFENDILQIGIKVMSRSSRASGRCPSGSYYTMGQEEVGRFDYFNRPIKIDHISPFRLSSGRV